MLNLQGVYGGGVEESRGWGWLSLKDRVEGLQDVKMTGRPRQGPTTCVFQEERDMGLRDEEKQCLRNEVLDRINANHRCPGGCMEECRVQQILSKERDVYVFNRLKSSADGSAEMGL